MLLCSRLWFQHFRLTHPVMWSTGKPLSGAASAPQRSDGSAALPYHSPAGASYMKPQMKINLKKKGGGVHNMHCHKRSKIFKHAYTNYLWYRLCCVCHASCNYQISTFINLFRTTLHWYFRLYQRIVSGESCARVAISLCFVLAGYVQTLSISFRTVSLVVPWEYNTPAKHP